MKLSSKIELAGKIKAIKNWTLRALHMNQSASLM